MTAREALRTIQEFVDLAVQRRTGSLMPDERTRIEALDAKLRDLIEGAKPRPKTIENPTAVSPLRNLKVGGLAQELEKTLEKKEQSKDQKKIRDVSTADLPRSYYTPSMSPAFLADYYDEGMVGTATLDLGGAILTGGAINADGSEATLTDDVKIWFGLAAPPPDPPSQTSAPFAAAANTAPQLGRPTIVHFVSGGTRRGEITPFEPHTGRLHFLGKDGSIDDVSLGEVLAVFLGLLKGEDATPASGESLVITLINDKKVAGLTQDYREGGDSLTLVPEPRRGNIDRIWIPASAVKAIEMA